MRAVRHHQLADASAPWHTKRQLARLGAVKRYPHETFRFAVLGDAEPGRFWFWRKLFGKAGVFETLVRRSQAEACDFDWIACNEHHYSPFSLMPNCNLIASIIAHRTKTAKVAVLGNLVPLLNPVRDRKSTRLNSSHIPLSRMPSSA